MNAQEKNVLLTYKARLENQVQELSSRINLLSQLLADEDGTPMGEESEDGDIESSAESEPWLSMSGSETWKEYTLRVLRSRGRSTGRDLVRVMLHTNGKRFSEQTIRKSVVRALTHGCKVGTITRVPKKHGKIIYEAND